jgi:hypothetical protein
MVSGHAKVVMLVGIVCALTTLAGEVLALHTVGLIGVAAVSAAGVVTQNVTLTLMSRRLAGITTWPGTWSDARAALHRE